jgi:hypothetical protein
MTFVAPTPDVAKLLAAWEAWERGEETPGKTMATLKTAGLRDVLTSLAHTGWTPSA